ncbi:GMC family oxidoreductase N-terminal domain-containing protein [Chelativorans sp.]|uniref:GMC family oxidoreductase n=1 Tax=Chelativorans sp. TaxID=2203393 RepID=UPI0028125EE6|nr:GMC family oxidoreductase N-terminal domain-containing protein [Chelativorans sp.]
MEEFDYIIVGAGSAGCVLADRLSASGLHRVLLLEAGGSDRRVWIKVPIGYGRTFLDRRVNWGFTTEPDAGLAGRQGYWPRGRVVGGSSSINALVYCRGLPGDFDDWRDAGNPGWGWEDVLPYFERSEKMVDGALSRGTGPLHVADVSREMHPLSRHYFAAAEELGLRISEDFNGPEPEGVGFYRITTRNGFRCSAADAFLRPALTRRNLRLRTDALVRRILFSGRRATGVEYECAGRILSASARREVILSAGAVGSPQILQLSGLGPGALLQRLGIGVVLDNVNIGGNLQDHLAVSYYFKAREPTLNDLLHPWHGKVMAGLRYVLTRRGPLSLSVNQCGGFVRSSPAAARPDLQLYFNPITYAKVTAGRRERLMLDPYPGFILCFQPTRPTSRGRIDIRSPKAGDPPSIVPNSLATEKDVQDVIAGGRFMQRIAATSAMRELIAEAIPPVLSAMSDADILEDFRQRCGTVFHPAGTCRMGAEPDGAVVDARLRVHGTEGLRVIDASVFPNLTSGNTNAPTIMVAQKGADLVLEG